MTSNSSLFDDPANDAVATIVDDERGDFAWKPIPRPGDLRSWSFFVLGVPVPKGSTRAFLPKGWTRSIITADNAKTKPWQAEIRAAAVDAQPEGIAATNGPVRIDVVFFFPRPTGHFGSGGNAGKLKATAPALHTVKPDADKLKRAVFDALKGIVFVDDARVCSGRAEKYYSRSGLPPGCHVTVTLLADLGLRAIPNLQPNAE